MFALMRSAIGTDFDLYNLAVNSKAGKTGEPQSLAAMIKTQTKFIQERLQCDFNSGKCQDRVQAGSSLLEGHGWNDWNDWFIFFPQCKIQLTNKAHAKSPAQ